MKKQYVKALILLQSFETFWTFCQLSNGELYLDECKKAAGQLVKQLRLINKTDKNIFNAKALRFSDKDETSEINGVIISLSKWSKNKEKAPYPRIFTSNFFIGIVFSTIKGYLVKKVDSSIDLQIVWSSRETHFAKSNIRWNAHLPKHMLHNIPDDLEQKLSSSSTIAVVGDIRKSQDLMTYTPSADFFREMMITFIQKSRDIIKSNFGIFDKFTGDGFLAYFNETVCKD